MQAINSDWGAAKAILILGGYRIFELDTSEIVMREVVRALERAVIDTGPGSDFARLCATARIAVHPAPSREAIEGGFRRYLPLMHHAADVPFLVSAREVKPDWLVSSNRRHFTPAVARASGLRIVTPAQLMRYLNVREAPLGP